MFCTLKLLFKAVSCLTRWMCQKTCEWKDTRAIYVQSKRFSKCEKELATETFDINSTAFAKPFSVFEMKITRSQNYYFWVAQSSRWAAFALRNILRFIKLWMKLVYSNVQNHGVNGYLKKMAANFAYRTCSKQCKLFAYGRNLWFPRYSQICYHVMLCYHNITWWPHG